MRTFAHSICFVGMFAVMNTMAVEEGVRKKLIRNIASKIAELSGKLAGLTNEGATFTRWGRSTCPPENELIYKGSAAGNNHGNRAGPSNTLCLPEDPEYAKYTPNNHVQGQIYGAEYESTIHFIKHLVNHDVPCAVCRSTKRRSAIMVPAKMTCKRGWHREYKGYLMSGHIGQAASQYMCLDGEPETIRHGHANMQGQLLYLVEGRCGSLPCPPYKHNAELTCVVCTK